MTWNKPPAADVGGSGGGGDDTGLARLRELGYKQELKRDLSYVPRLRPARLSRSFNTSTSNRQAHS